MALDGLYALFACTALMIYIFGGKTMSTEPGNYVIVMPGIIKEKLVGSGPDPEALAETMIAVSRANTGKTYTLRSPEGALVAMAVDGEVVA